MGTKGVSSVERGRLSRNSVLFQGLEQGLRTEGGKPVKKILYCASTVSHILNFHLPYLEAFQKKGYEVWVAANKEEKIPFADHVIALPFEKSLSSPRNLRAVLAVRRLLRKERFDKISTHTTLASAVVRAAVLISGVRPHVFCTSHGYLFHEWSGWKKWIYLLPEKICGHVTDVLMVMNREDYGIAQRHHLSRGQIFYTHGMGVDFARFPPVVPEEKESIRKNAGMGREEFVFAYAAEFSPRKNQALLVRSFARIAEKYPQVRLILAGTGALQEECIQLAKDLGQEDRISFPGYVTKVRELYAMSDACVSTSHIEGLPFNLMEAMACGLPVVASDVKGHQELVENGKTGWLFPDENEEALCDRLEKLICLRGELLPPEEIRMRAENYSLEKVFPELMQIYGE